MATLAKLTIKSRLLLMLLAVGGISCLLLSGIAYWYCEAALRQRVTDQLTSIRDSRSTQIESYLQGVQRHVGSLAEDLSVVEASREFRKVLRDQDEFEISEEDQQRLERFYETVFFPQIATIEQGEPMLRNYLPQSDYQRYLQSRYVIASQVKEAPPGSEPNTSGDQSAEEPTVAQAEENASLVSEQVDETGFEQIDARYRQQFQTLTRVFGYDDLFLVDAETLDVMYTSLKEVDFATNLRTGPFSDSSLAQAVRSVAQSPNKSFVATADFQFYRASRGAPAAFVAAPIYDGNEKIAVIAIQFPIDEINEIMTGKKQWSESGLGETGETFLVGGDGTMRSDARALLEDHASYIDAIANTRLSPERVEMIDRLGTTILLRPVDNEVIELALRGERGVRIVEHLRGHQSLVAYCPLQVDGLDWCLMAEMKASEAFSPLQELRRTLVLSSVGLLLMTTLLAMYLSAHLTHPIERFVEEARQVVSGRQSLFSDTSRDEFGVLAGEINHLVTELRRETEQINLQSAGLMQTLCTLVPTYAIDRLTNDEDDTFVKHKNVAVLSARVMNFPKFDGEEGPQRRLEMLHQLTLLIDDIVDEARMEKVKADGYHYLATCGAIVPRLDSARRAMEFANNLHDKVHYFNQQNSTQLVICIGIDLGSIVSGFIGSQNLDYDVWGEPVSRAIAMGRLVSEESVFVSATIEPLLREHYELVPIDLETDDPDAEPVYRFSKSVETNASERRAPTRKA